MPFENSADVRHCNLLDELSLGSIMKLTMAQTQWFTASELGFPKDSVMAGLMRNSGNGGGVEKLLAKAGKELGDALIYSEEVSDSERLPVKLLQNIPAMELAGTELARMFWNRGIKHAVVHVVPQMHSMRISNEKEKATYEAKMIMALLYGIKYIGSVAGIKVELVLGMLGNETKEDRLANARTVWLAKKFKDCGVIGVEQLGSGVREDVAMANLAKKHNVKLCA